MIHTSIITFQSMFIYPPSLSRKKEKKGGGGLVVRQILPGYARAPYPHLPGLAANKYK